MTSAAALSKVIQALASRMLVALSLCLLALATPAWAAYTDNGNSTVSDSKTGLMWDQCSLGQTATPKTPSSAPTCSGTPSTLTWSQGFEYVAKANAANHRGYNDWRMPTIGELKTLVYTATLATCLGYPLLIDLTYFPGSDCGSYMSSTAYMDQTATWVSSNWRIDFNGNDGKIPYISNDPWPSSGRFRLVRGTPFFDPFASGAAAPIAAANDTTTARLTATATANAVPFGGTLSTGTTAHYIVVASGAATPTAAQVFAGGLGVSLGNRDYDASPIVASGSGLVGTIATWFNITGLTRGAAYDLYLIGTNNYKFSHSLVATVSFAYDLSQINAPNTLGSPGVVKLSFVMALPQVTYNGNGNTGGSVPIDTVPYSTGDTVIVSGNTGALVNTGYAFTGWNTAADGSGAAYAPGDRFAIPSNTTLYAQWSRYVDQADSTVTDLQTGLMWDQCGLGQAATAKTPSTPPACTGSAAAYSWSDAFNAATAANAANYRGHNDWRVPTVEELNGLAYVRLGGKTCPQTASTPVINTVYFPGTACSKYWTSTHGTGFYASAAVHVDFSGGYGNNFGNSGKNAGNFVRLVRGGAFFDPFAPGAAAPTVAVGHLPLTLSATATSAGTTAHYIVVASGATAPNAAQIFDAGTGSLGGDSYGGMLIAQGSGAVGTVATPLTLSGLTSGTAYDLYLMGESSANDLSQVSAPGTFGTLDTIPLRFTAPFAVTYDGNGNTSGSVPLDSNGYARGATATVLDSAPATPLARINNLFNGWNTRADGTGTAYVAGATFTVNANTTLYAQWRAVTNVCGTATSVATLIAPSANLCSAGAASPVTATANTFNWSCQGGAGVTATCSAPRQYTVTASPAVGASGTLSCAASAVIAGGTTSCTAVPGAGYATQSISGCSGSTAMQGTNSYTTGAITADCTVTASFSPIPSACGTAASVATLAAPSANLCSANHTAGVVSSGANTFDWACQDQVSSATASCSAPRRYTIATTVTPPGLVIGPRVFGAGGSVSCVGASVVMAGASGTYLGGNTVTCTAAANPGFAFGAFSGDCSGGSCTLANAAGDKALTASFLKSQSIRFDTPQFVSVQTNAGPLTLRPYAIATSDLRQTGLPVTLVSTTTNVCTVSGAGPTYTVNLIAAGACLLTAAQAGDATYAPASLDVNFLVTPASTYSYTDHNDGTVTDADNGLMWDQCSMGQTTTATTANSPPACNGAASGLTWSQAFDSAVSANAARYKGYGDWRLPTVGELSTLVKGKACPTIDATYFPGTACDYPYRSSTNYAPDSANAWSVDFNEGSSNIPTKVNYTHHVRLVRGETFFDPFASGAEAPAITPSDPTTAMLSLTATANATALGGTQSTGTTAYYIVVAPGAVVPNAAQIFDAGTRHLSSTYYDDAYSGTIIVQGSGAVGTTTTDLAITGLAVGTTYDLYVIGTNSHSIAQNNDLSQVSMPGTAGSGGVIKLSFTHAQTQPRPYRMAYDGNSATGGAAPTDGSSPYGGGATVTVLGNTGSLVKTGYTFAGWNTAADGSGTAYAAGSTFGISASTVLYAQWAAALQMQTIAFTAPASVLLNAGPLTLTPTASSGLAVTLTSTTTNICTVSGTGPFTVTLIAVGTCGLTATQAGNTFYAAATPVHVDFAIGATPLTSFTGATATGTGDATAAFTGGGAGCGYTQSQFIDVTSLGAAPPAGYALPQGLFQFVTANCTSGSTLTMNVTYAQPIPAGAVFYKFGKTADNPTPHWYQHPATISGATLTYQVTDGGAGDDDLTRNGSMADPGGLAVPLAEPAAAVAVPTLAQWAQLLLCVLLVLCGTPMVQRKRAR